MNAVQLTGNVTRDPETHTTQNGVKRANFTLAVDRRYADANGNRQADFLPIVAWRQLADFVEKYITKGKKLGIQGSIQTRSYDAQDGTKKYVTEIVADSIEFLTPREQTEAPAAPAEPPAAPAERALIPASTRAVQERITEEYDDELPF